MKIKNLFWRIVAQFLSRPLVVKWIVAKAKKTPDTDIISDGKLYMERWWLFNPYLRTTRKRKYPWIPFSLRVHNILLPDQDRALHDHPWKFRTFILRGFYLHEIQGDKKFCRRWMCVGSTNSMDIGDFHRIDSVSQGGVITLCLLGRYRGDWGFHVDGKKVLWREYLGLKGDK